MTGTHQTGRVLIAGCGDVGRRVASRLRDRGHAVATLRRTERPAAAGIDAIAADLTRPESLRSLPRDIDRVVYLPTPDSRTLAAYRAVFVDGLAHLLDALDAMRLRRLLFVSSSAVYGEHHGAWVDEDTLPSPPGFNGETLLQAESWLAGQGVPSVVLRLAGLYGPGRCHVIDRLRAGTARVPRQPPFWANRIHADDAAAAIVHLLELADPKPLYIGSDGSPMPLADLYDALAERLGVQRPPEGAPPQGIGNKRLSNARLCASGFVPCWPDALEGHVALLSAD